jgi:hypothetical protein
MMSKRLTFPVASKRNGLISKREARRAIKWPIEERQLLMAPEAVTVASTPCQNGRKRENSATIKTKIKIIKLTDKNKK